MHVVLLLSNWFLSRFVMLRNNIHREVKYMKKKKNFFRISIHI
jgi:hypothetical protein